MDKPKEGRRNKFYVCSVRCRECGLRVKDIHRNKVGTVKVKPLTLNQAKGNIRWCFNIQIRIQFSKTAGKSWLHVKRPLFRLDCVVGLLQREPGYQNEANYVLHAQAWLNSAQSVSLPVIKKVSEDERCSTTTTALGYESYEGLNLIYFWVIAQFSCSMWGEGHRAMK